MPNWIHGNQVFDQGGEQQDTPKGIFGDVSRRSFHVFFGTESKSKSAFSIQYFFWRKNQSAFCYGEKKWVKSGKKQSLSLWIAGGISARYRPDNGGGPPLGTGLAYAVPICPFPEYSRCMVTPNQSGLSPVLRDFLYRCAIVYIDFHMPYAFVGRTV